MAGSALAITITNKESANQAFDVWQVSSTAAHPLLIALILFRCRFRSIASAAPRFSRPPPHPSSSSTRELSGMDGAVFALSLDQKPLSCFTSRSSWPQISCLSGFQARGSGAIFLSYKDGAG
ncbi:uncharacterized protein LOC121771304 [Salvia splendens]|uniref:uncharacterized protein LOC121771304 n=1 Tax=Salvia splendens TaxID=180675 RepID=UPI0010FFD1F3|nr:uncharacterized protein LOC121771304 [Salvia splendens]